MVYSPSDFVEMQSVVTIADPLSLFFIVYGFILPHLYVSVTMLFMSVKKKDEDKKKMCS